MASGHQVRPKLYTVTFDKEQTCYVIYGINCVASLIPDISCVASMPFTTPLPWPDGIVKCPSDVHFVISVEVVGRPGTFQLLFYECEFWSYYSFHIKFFSQVIRHIECDTVENEAMRNRLTSLFPAVSSTWLHRYYLNWSELEDDITEFNNEMPLTEKWPFYLVILQ